MSELQIRSATWERYLVWVLCAAALGCSIFFLAIGEPRTAILGLILLTTLPIMARESFSELTLLDDRLQVKRFGRIVCEAPYTSLREIRFYTDEGLTFKTNGFKSTVFPAKWPGMTEFLEALLARAQAGDDIHLVGDFAWGSTNSR